MNLFEMKSKAAELTTAINDIKDEITAKAADPNVSVDDLNTKKAKADELVTRLGMLQDGIKEAEEAQKKSVASGVVNGESAEDVMLKAKADYFRAVATKGDVAKAYQGLGGIPAGSADLGNGSALLPTNLSNEIITEPIEENSLRQVEETSQIAGLEEPRVSFDIDDDDLLEDVVDGETAKEIAVSSDSVSFGRYKTKVKVQISDTVVYGTNTDLISEVEGALRSALARKEKVRAFATSADDDHKHMSFYMAGIKAINGTDIIDAICKALGDLPDAFRAKAKCVMRAQDWFAYVRTMANGAIPLYGKKPEDVIGCEVVFNDKAVIPVVGDFHFAKQNYDPVAVLDADKDIDKGWFKYVLTAWGDHQIKLKSAFRLAIVATAIIGGTATKGTNKIDATPVFNVDPSVAPTSGITYLWQYEDDGVWTDTTSSYTGYNTASLTTTSADDGVSFRCKVTYDGKSVFTNVVKM